MGDVTTAVGPQSDGTFDSPAAAQPLNQPWDASGNPPGAYDSGTLDIFKYGIGVLNAIGNYSLANKQLDYNRYEANNGGLFQQGVPAIPRTASGSIAPGFLLMAGGAVLLLVLLTHKG